MSKSYKISYKTYLNDRLNQVSFHGKSTYPLYVQVTFERKSMIFKSYYFELFAKTRYVLFSPEGKRGPTLPQVIKKESELIEYVIEKTQDNFSLDLFRKEYLYYAQDLCDLTEPGFSDYLFTFFHDKGMPALATSLREGGKLRLLFDIVQDLRLALNKPLYNEMVENSFFYAPPYLPLFGYIMESKKWPLFCLTVMEWEKPVIKKDFENHLTKYYPLHSVREIIKLVDKCLMIK